ncbi:hypothetical protein BDR26DRAFT_870663 [Obelidium mucronatum]|nr:hypothetical protein BDR26DRAFT_870663 [Obelidium mucronatum]
MRSLCRHIQNCLLDPHFALVVLKREIELEGCEFEARVDIGTLTDQDSLTEMDLVWFKMPEPYASIYARLQFLSLRSVYLTNSSIDGRLPPTISELPLHTLVINSSELKGRLPVSLGRLRFLKRLSLANNLVKGNIPKEISNLGLLKVLDLSGNRLTGSIPDLYNLQSLQTLNFSSNSLSGQIPSSLGSLENLITLNLSNNNLTGTIPDLTILPRLDILDLSENRLMSPIPDLPYTLQEVQLNNNSFTGPIPVHLTRLSKLRTLSLSHNHFTLTIPAGFGKMPRLLNLNLSHNKLIGSIPPFDESCFLTDLDLSSNNLSTGIVPDMDLLTSLETITVTLTHADKGDNDGIFVSHLTPCEECDCVGGCLRQRQRMNLEQRKWEFNICYRQEFVSMILNDVRPSSFRSSLSYAIIRSQSSVLGVLWSCQAVCYG